MVAEREQVYIELDSIELDTVQELVQVVAQVCIRVYKLEQGKAVVLAPEPGKGTVVAVVLVLVLDMELVE
jgi:hypothetical protein